MKISPLSMDLRAGKAPGSHAIELEAVSSAFSRMGSAADALPSPDGLRPVRTAWRQPEDVAKVGVSHGRSQTSGQKTTGTADSALKVSRRPSRRQSRDLC